MGERQTLRLATMLAHAFGKIDHVDARKRVETNIKEGIIFVNGDPDVAILTGIGSVRAMMEGKLETPLSFEGFTIIQDRKKIIGRITTDGAFEEHLHAPLMVPCQEMVVEKINSIIDAWVGSSPANPMPTSHKDQIRFTGLVK